MTMKYLQRWVMLGAAILAQAVVAQETGDISGRIGTLGFGIEYSRPIDETLSVRVGLNGFDYGTDLEESGIHYDGDLRLRNIALIGDLHPWKNGFHISGGAMYNGNDFSIEATPENGVFSFNDVDYSAADVGSASGEIDFNRFAPYLGIGWRSSHRREAGLSFNADIGFMYHGEPDASLSVTCGSAIPTLTCAQLQRDVDAERDQLQDELSSFKWYPVLSLGLGYKF